jgi:hypothetical protein
MQLAGAATLLGVRLLKMLIFAPLHRMLTLVQARGVACRLTRLYGGRNFLLPPRSTSAALRF